MQELERIRQIQEQINILKKEYDYCKDIVDEIDVGIAMGLIRQLNHFYYSHLDRMQEINEQVFLMRCDLVRLNEQAKAESYVKVSATDYIEYEG